MQMGHNIFTILVLIISSSNLWSTTNGLEKISDNKIQLNVIRTPAATIREDVISDSSESSTQKIIRINPLDLPPINPEDKAGMDSSLIKIQQLFPQYVPSVKLRKPKVDGQIFRPIKPQKRPKKQRKLKFLYDIKTGVNSNDGRPVTVPRLTRVHLAPGAYPVYYVIAKVNGQFKKSPIKSYRNENELIKSLTKIKPTSE